MASPHNPLVSFPTSDPITNTIPAQDYVIPSANEPISTAPIPDLVPSPSSLLPILESQSPNEVVSMPNSNTIPGNHAIPNVDVDVVPLNPSLRRPQRISKLPAYLQSYKCSLVHCDQSTHFTSSIKSGSSSTILGIKYPLSTYLTTSKLSPSYANFCSLITNIPEPKSYFEAVKNPK